MEPRDDHFEPPTRKKGYVTPKLVRLGSVRDLTFGTSRGSSPDGTFTKVAK